MKNSSPKDCFLFEKTEIRSKWGKIVAFLVDFKKDFKINVWKVWAKTKFEMLPKVLKQDYPSKLDSKYETQNLIRPNDPVLVIKTKEELKLLLWLGALFPWIKDLLDKERPRPFNARSETVEEKNYLGELKHKRCLIPASGFFEKNIVFEKRIMRPSG